MNIKSRKDLKKLGRKSLKKHYVIFVAACLIAAFLGSEFTTSLDFLPPRNVKKPSRNSEKNLQGDFSSAVKTEVNSSTTWDDVLRTIAENDTEAGREMSEQIEEDEIREAESEAPYSDAPAGVLSGLVNQLSSGSIIVTMVGGPSHPSPVLTISES